MQNSRTTSTDRWSCVAGFWSTFSVPSSAPASPAPTMLPRPPTSQPYTTNPAGSSAAGHSLPRTSRSSAKAAVAKP